MNERIYIHTSQSGLDGSRYTYTYTFSQSTKNKFFRDCVGLIKDNSHKVAYRNNKVVVVSESETDMTFIINFWVHILRHTTIFILFFHIRTVLEYTKKVF